MRLLARAAECPTTASAGEGLAEAGQGDSHRHGHRRLIWELGPEASSPSSPPASPSRVGRRGLWQGGLLTLATVVIVWPAVYRARRVGLSVSLACARTSSNTSTPSVRTAYKLIRLTQPRRGPIRTERKSQSKLPFHEDFGDWLARNRAAAAWQGSPWSLSRPERRRLVWGQKLCLVPASGPTTTAKQNPVCPLQVRKRMCAPGVLCRVARFASRYSEMTVLYQGARKVLPHHQ